jgi:hypothetical protein
VTAKELDEAELEILSDLLLHAEGMLERGEEPSPVEL